VRGALEGGEPLGYGPAVPWTVVVVRTCNERANLQRLPSGVPPICWLCFGHRLGQA